MASEHTMKLVSFLDGETGREAVERLEAEGYTLHNISELADFVAKHLEELRTYTAIIVLGKDSLWTHPDGNVEVAGVVVGRSISGKTSRAHIGWFADHFDSHHGTLVSSRQKEGENV